MQIALAQINPTVGDIAGNCLKIKSKITKALARGAELVIFPELSLSGYPPEDLLLLPEFVDQLEDALQEVIEHTKGIAALVGTVRRNLQPKGKPLFNSAAVIVDGVLLGYHDKMLLPTYDVFDERRFFEPGSGLRLWDIYGKHIAVTICEDIWQHGALPGAASYTQDPIAVTKALQPDLIVNLSASPFSLSKFSKRLEVCFKGARTVKAPLALCNQVGGNDSLIFDGKSLVVNAKGELVARAKGFVEDLMIVDLKAVADNQIDADDSMKDLHDALVLGLKDYFHKSGFSKACLGLSGGIDSAVVACLAVHALGQENVSALLMPSCYSSEGSIADAEALANTLAIKSYRLPIGTVFDSYLDLLNPYLDPLKPGITEENIQARIRGMLLMAFSNRTGCIVLATGNKSELAMGYSTLYGDMCGGLAVIGDLTKRHVYALAHRINREREIIPLNTLNKAPSAELRPNQKDSDTLPDYEVVDNVVEAYLEDNKSPRAIAKTYGYDLNLVNGLIQRIYRNEYKRRQAPPVLRVTEKAFSAGRRYPIVQGLVR